MALFSSAAPSAPPSGVDDAYDSNGQEAREREIEGGGAPSLRLSVSSQIPNIYLISLLMSSPQNHHARIDITGH